MIGYVHVEEPTKQLEFDFSEPTPPKEPEWFQPDLFLVEESRDPGVLYFNTLSGPQDVTLSGDYSTVPGTMTITTTPTPDPEGWLCLTDSYKIASNKLPNIWNRFWQRIIFGFKWIGE